MFFITVNHPQPLQRIPESPNTFSSPHIHPHPPHTLFSHFQALPLIFTHFLYLSTVLRFDNSITCPHTPMNSPSRSLDEMLLFEATHPFLTPYTISSHFYTFSTHTRCFYAFNTSYSCHRKPEHAPEGPHPFSRPNTNF